MNVWHAMDSAPKSVEILVWLRGNRDDAFNERAAVARFDSATSNVTGELFWIIPGVGGLKASHWMPAPLAPAGT